MATVLLIPLIPLLAVLFYAFVLFDRLVRAEYELHKPEWEADGRPTGFFWLARECRWFSIPSYLARTQLSLAWLFHTPSWVAQSPPLRIWLRRQRLAVLIWNVGALIWFVFFVKSI